jgi:hypothetical protein
MSAPRSSTRRPAPAWYVSTGIGCVITARPSSPCAGTGVAAEHQPPAANWIEAKKRPSSPADGPGSGGLVDVAEVRRLRAEVAGFPCANGIPKTASAFSRRRSSTADRDYDLSIYRCPWLGREGPLAANQVASALVVEVAVTTHADELRVDVVEASGGHSSVRRSLESVAALAEPRGGDQPADDRGCAGRTSGGAP